MLVLLFLCGAATAAASASAPAPQKAPSSGQSGQPSPDPAPQAEVKPRVSIPRASAISRPVVVSPAPAETTPRLVQLETSQATTAAPSSGGRPSAPSRPGTTHRSSIAHRPPATHHAKSQVTSLAFPLALPKDLVLLPHAGTDSRNDGVLLLLSAVAMGVLTLASLSLLRRLRRLELR